MHLQPDHLEDQLKSALKFVHRMNIPVTLTLFLDECWPLGPHLWRQMLNNSFAKLHSDGVIRLTPKGVWVISSHDRLY